MMRCFSLLLIYVAICLANGSVVIKTKWADLNVTTIHKEDTSLVKNFLYTKSAVYGINSPYNAVYGQLVLALSTDVNPQTNVTYQNSFGCSKYENANLPGSFIALVSRGECSFERKIQVATDSKAIGIIVYNDQQETFNMLVRNSSIPNVLTDYSHGTEFINYLKTSDVYVGINPGQVEMVENSSLPSRASIYFVAIAFLVVLVVTIIWLSVYYVQKYRFYNAKKRLDNRLKKATQKALSKMPVRKLKNDDTLINETCAICLENYIANDSIRELPCGHYFHQKDVDLWLVEHRTCPMCKINVLQALGIEYISRMPVSFIGVRPSESNAQTVVNDGSTSQPSQQTESVTSWSRENPVEVDELTPSTRVNVRRNLEAGSNSADNNFKVVFTKNSPTSINVVDKSAKIKQINQNSDSHSSKGNSRKISKAKTSSRVDETAPTDPNNDFTDVPL